MDSQAKAFVRERAKHRCEYCLVPEALSYLPFHIEHVVAVKHGGSDDESNLALACRNCNLPLYHPRSDTWSEHFMFRGCYIDGKTPAGRATVYVLSMNDEDQVAIREALRVFAAE